MRSLSPFVDLKARQGLEEVRSLLPLHDAHEEPHF